VAAISADRVGRALARNALAAPCAVGLLALARFPLWLPNQSRVISQGVPAPECARGVSPWAAGNGPRSL
jgi:hypothetical protein